VPGRDPNIVISDLSRTVTIDRVTVEFQVFQLERDHQWTLDGINDEDTSTVWNTMFVTDDEALAAIRLTLEGRAWKPSSNGVT
jgi:hypothetical protein